MYNTSQSHLPSSAQYDQLAQRLVLRECCLVLLCNVLCIHILSLPLTHSIFVQQHAFLCSPWLRLVTQRSP